MTQPSVLPTFLTARARLVVALAAGIVVFAILSLPMAESWVGSFPLRIALSWDAVSACYLALAIRMMWRWDMARIRARAKAADIGLVEIVVTIVLVGLFSLFSVAVVLTQARGLPVGDRIAHVAVGAVTVLLSWTCLHVIYAVHYAHLFYDPAEKEEEKKKNVRGGLEFPNEKEPDYWDFVYFSFVIGMTCQVSDVQVTERHMRHLVTAQGIIAFFYNTVVVALAVNTAASLG